MARSSGPRRGARGRGIVALLAALALGVAAAACGSGNGGGGGSSGGSETADPNGVLKYGWDFANIFTNTFDPAQSKSPCDIVPYHLIYDTLIRFDDNGQLVPGLAKSWKLEGTTLTLELQPNVKFSDGSPFDANAVKAGLLHNQTNEQLTDLGLIVSIDVLSPTSLRLNLKDKTGVKLLYDFTSIDGVIIAPSSASSAATKPVGAGPFKLDSYSAGSTISVRKNPGYFQPDRYKLAGVDFQQVTTGPPSVTAVKSGAVDFIRIETENYETLQGDSKVGVATIDSTGYLQFEFRQDRGPFQNVHNRKAVAYALNRKEINDVVQSGLGTVASQLYPENSPFFDPSLKDAYPNSVDKAKEELRLAGNPDGFTFEMVIPGPNLANMDRQGAIVQQQLAKVGIKANITKIPGNSIAPEYYINRRGDAFVAAQPGADFAPNQLNGNYGVGQFVAKYDGQENAQISALMQQAYETSDTTQLASLVKQGDKIVIDNALEVPIAFMPQLVGYIKARVGGKPTPATDVCNAPDLTKVFIKKG